MPKMVLEVTESFESLRRVFRELGYPVPWRAGEWRDLPQDLIDRLLAAGFMLTPYVHARDTLNPTPWGTKNEKEAS